MKATQRVLLASICAMVLVACAKSSLGLKNQKEKLTNGIYVVYGAN